MAKSEEQERLEQEIIDKVLAFAEADEEAATIASVMVEKENYTGPIAAKRAAAIERRDNARYDFTAAAKQLQKLREAAVGVMS